MTRSCHSILALSRSNRALVRSGLTVALLLCSLTMTQAQDDPSPQLEVSDLQRSVELADSIEALETRIQAIQSESGTYHLELLPSLDELAQVYIEAQDFEAAAQMLDHQLQIHRINSGLYAAAQIPIVEAMLRLHARADDWSSINDSLDNLAWL